MAFWFGGGGWVCVIVVIYIDIEIYSHISRNEKGLLGGGGCGGSHKYSGSLDSYVIYSPCI